MEPAIEQFFTGRRNWKFYDEIIKIVRPGEENPRPGATTISYFATNLEDLYKGLFYNVKKLLLVIIDVTTCRILSVVTMLLPVNDFDQIKPRISLENVSLFETSKWWIACYTAELCICYFPNCYHPNAWQSTLLLFDQSPTNNLIRKCILPSQLDIILNLQ